MTNYETPRCSLCSFSVPKQGGYVRKYCDECLDLKRNKKFYERLGIVNPESWSDGRRKAKEIITREYVENQKPIEEIALQYKIFKSTLTRFMLKVGIETRTRSEAMKISISKGKKKSYFRRIKVEGKSFRVRNKAEENALRNLTRIFSKKIPLEFISLKKNYSPWSSDIKERHFCSSEPVHDRLIILFPLPVPCEKAEEHKHFKLYKRFRPGDYTYLFLTTDDKLLCVKNGELTNRFG